MVLDIILIAIILLGIFIGYKRGFVKVVIKLTSFIVAILFAYILSSSVAEYIGDTLGLNNTISTSIENKLHDFTNSNSDEEKEGIQIPILKKSIQKINDASDEKKEEITIEWSQKITDFIIKGISFIAIFVVISILMGVIGIILDTIFKLPVLKTLNGTLGAAIEFVLVLARILILLAIISFLSPLEILDVVTKYINESCITKWLYENNIIISIIGRKLL